MGSLGSQRPEIEHAEYVRQYAEMTRMRDGVGMVGWRLTFGGMLIQNVTFDCADPYELAVF
ncbi:hypothetical protein [Nocardia arthritidis]|uniref:Uncharacterized protein n=1 Tax=Nocardia arthritidis TaxID=228602 RepID=A0A6G9YND4_9NOCA|nr:hypothetical protein [Nocardia arthritidis]QIS14714.1 hypothetical protein F5544_34405 [Nocardia arthritidis]